MSFSYTISVEKAKNFYDYNGELEWAGGVSIPESVRNDTAEFQSFVGCEFDFHGEQSNMVRLNDLVYEFLEDPDDGYRSHLGAVVCTPATDHTGFFSTPIAKVVLIDSSDEETWPDDWVPPAREKYTDGPFNGFYFVDADDFHVWCQVGTEYHDAYYPMFICRYNPKQGT